MVSAEMQEDLGRDILTTMSQAPYSQGGLSLYVGMTKDTNLSKEEDWLTFIRSDLRQMTNNYLHESCNSTL